MNIADYRARFGVNLPAMSESCRKARSKAGKKYFADIRNRLARRAKKRRELLDWDLAVRFSAGTFTAAEIAREFHRDPTGITLRAKQLDFRGTNCPHYFGQRVDSEFARYLKTRSGLSAGEHESMIGAKKGALTPLLYPHGGRQRNTPELAAELILWLDKTLSALLKTDFRGKPNSLPGHKSALIFTLVLNFHANFWLLLRALKGSRKFLLHNPSVGTEELREYLCNKARFEVETRIRKKVFAPFLKWSWQLDYLMIRDLKRLRGTERLEYVACDWIASRWGTGRGIVYTALRCRSPKIRADRMANLIRLFSAQKKHHGRTLGAKAKDTQPKIRLAAALSLLRYSQQQMVPHLYPMQHDREAGRKAVQKFLKRYRSSIQEEKASISATLAPDIVNAGLSSNQP